MPEIIIIAAVAQNKAIGYKNGLLYRLSADMKHFKSLTVGNTVLMGRKTFESLPKGALPDRRNIVVSRNRNAEFPGCELFHSIDEALAACKPDEKVFIIGGASIYSETIGIATRLALTFVHDTPEKQMCSSPNTIIRYGKKWGAKVTRPTNATKKTSISWIT